MKVDITTGLLDEARLAPSPHWDARPADTDIDLLVVHSISLPPCEFGGPWIDALFTNTLDPAAHPYFQAIAALKVSAHLLIRRDGEIVQYVPFHGRAWHAGQSRFGERTTCNNFSIGIELEGCDEQPFEPVQYTVLASVVAALSAAYPLLADPRHIVGHCHIAPERKTDPGPLFDWTRLTRLVAAEIDARRPA